jgi:hypothetical protein
MASEHIGIEYFDEAASGTGYKKIMMIIDIENFAHTCAAHADFLRDAFKMPTAAAIEFANH